MLNLWNILIFTFILAGTLMVSYGIYGIIYTRRLHVNAWLIRGMAFLIPAFYLYFNYKYNGKVVLTAIMPTYLTALFSCSLIFVIFSGFFDRIKEEYQANHGADKGKYAKHMKRHHNTWNDPKRLWVWLKEETGGIAEGIQGMRKNKKPKAKDKDKNRVIEPVTQPVPVNREGLQIQKNMAARENVLIQHNPTPIARSTGQLQRPGHTGLLQRPGQNMERNPVSQPQSQLQAPRTMTIEEQIQALKQQKLAAREQGMEATPRPAQPPRVSAPAPVPAPSYYEPTRARVYKGSIKEKR